jgi:glycine dehydrogenase
MAAFEPASRPDPGRAAPHSAFLTHPVFNTHHSETEMLRYIRSLATRTWRWTAA